MAKRGRGFPNPFYALLMVVSTMFVITTLAYLIGPSVERRALEDPTAIAPGRRAFAAWFDRNGVLALGVEFGIMLVSAILAMVTDHWFSVKKPGRNAANLD
jgi:ABC-type uncharacterized transport system permease subunit